MKWMLLALMTVVLAACSGESLSPERKACLEKASTEAERIECNKESAIEADKKAEDADPRPTKPTKAAASGLPAA